MRLCRDCHYCSIILTEHSGATLFICKHPKSLISQDLVTGIEKHYKCDLMRSNYMPCGEKGMLFVEKDTLVKKVKRKFKSAWGKDSWGPL